MLDLSAVQGNIAQGYPFSRARFVFLHFDSAAGGRAFLAGLRPRVTTGARWPAGQRPTSARNIALTAAGLAALGLPAEVLGTFPEEFRQDMAARSRQLRDAEPDHLAHWAPAWRRPGDVHALVSLHADHERGLDEEQAVLLGQPWAAGVRVVVEERGARLGTSEADPRRRTEHFGFADGLSQPILAGTGAAAPGRPVLPVGEILLGHLDGEGFLPPAPAPGVLAHDGTFLVFRKLAQDVDAFRAFIADRGATYPGGPEELAAKAMGRWPDGRPLARPGTTEESLDFADDTAGARCPVGAHVRRANPRRSFGPDRQRFFDRHRMLRRGIPYTEAGERGLLFVCLCASIARQFEFVQSQWLNDGNALGLGDERDAIAGSHPASANGTMTVPGNGDSGRPVWIVPRLPRLVTVRGGAYFFVPSIAALGWLARGSWAHPTTAGIVTLGIVTPGITPGTGGTGTSSGPGS